MILSKAIVNSSIKITCIFCCEVLLFFLRYQLQTTLSKYLKNMNVVNDNIVKKIISLEHSDAETTMIKWSINDNIVKAGNNFTSEVFHLIIEYRQHNDEEKKHIFLKVPSNSPMYEVGTELEFYVKEEIMYTKILPQLHAIDGDHLAPICYHLGEKHSLFLEDLMQCGYRMSNRNEQLDFEHCSQALKRLAKFHALSVKLERDQGIPDFIKKDVLTSEENKDHAFVASWVSGIAKFHEHLDPDIQRKYSKEIEYFSGTTIEHLAEDIDPSRSSFNVLTHGDFWTNNIMFKYDEYGIIEKVKFVDFQGSRWTNPALDLIHFTMNSMRFEVFEKYFDLLLAIYLDTLNKILKRFDCQMYTLECLKEDIEKRCRFAYMVLACFLPFTLRDSNDIIDTQKVLDSSGNNLSEVQESFKQKQCLEITTKWFLYLAQKNGNGSK